MSKAECFRAAARSKPYDGPNARDAFIAKRSALVEIATKAGLTPLPDPVGSSEDKRRPPEPMDAAWYIANRLGDQAQFYAKRQQRNETGVSRVRLLTLAISLLAAGLGAIGSTYKVSIVAPWIGVMGTLGAMVLAYGALERRQYLAVSYGAIAEALARIRERYDTPNVDLGALVSDTESLLEQEHLGWAEKATKTIQTSTSIIATTGLVAPQNAGDS